MDRITGANATVDNRFQDGNAGTGQRATSFNADWANGVQEELMTIIEAGGFTGNAAAFDLVMKAMINLTYFVGVTLTLNNNTNPNALYPWQTWVEDTTGRVVASRDPSQVEFDTLGKQGGAKLVTLTVDQLPPHKHATPKGSSEGDEPTTTTNGGGASGDPVETSSTGGGLPHPNLQPYIVRRVWIRTA